MLLQNSGMKETAENPFSYSPPTAATSAHQYKRIDPSAFWNPSSFHSGARRVRKPRQERKEESVTARRPLPRHLQGRFKPAKTTSRTKVGVGGGAL